MGLFLYWWDLVIPLLVAWTVIKLRIDTCSFYFVRSLALELIWSHPQSLVKTSFSKVMRLVNFLMTLFGPVSFLSLSMPPKKRNCNNFLIIFLIIIIKSSLWFVAQFSKWENFYLCLFLTPVCVCFFLFKCYLGDNNRDCVMARFRSSQKWTFTQRRCTRSRLRINSSLDVRATFVINPSLPPHAFFIYLYNYAVYTTITLKFTTTNITRCLVPMPLK